MKIFDLTNTLTQKIKTYPTGPDDKPETAPRVEIVKQSNAYHVGDPWRLMETDYLSKLTTSGYNWMHYVMDSHAGTHVDAPYHFDNDGLKIGDVPLERYVNNAILLNVKDSILRPENILALRDKIRNRILLLYTGWPEKRTFGEDSYFFDFPTFGPEIGQAILDVGALAVGVDTPSIDALDGHFENHYLLLPNNVVLIENLTNLHSLLDVPEFIFNAAPLKIHEGDASPVRAFAIIK